ncbi:hypothetical protein [Cryptosporangium japonicum]|uniref:hypothetical protein n=1 Tax=Cryptosporangium japonicum TaxID=80872 RepID=UPI0031D5D542
MHSWIKRGTCVGVLSAGLVVSAAAGASAAVTPVVVGQGGTGGQGGNNNEVVGSGNTVANGGHGGTTDAPVHTTVPATLGMPIALPGLELPAEVRQLLGARGAWLAALSQH